MLISFSDIYHNLSKMRNAISLIEHVYTIDFFISRRGRLFIHKDSQIKPYQPIVHQRISAIHSAKICEK